MKYFKVLAVVSIVVENTVCASAARLQQQTEVAQQDSFSTLLQFCPSPF